MTTDKDIGKLEGKMDLVLDQIKTVHIKLDKITEHGCVKGATNEAAIASLNRRTTKVEGWMVKATVIAVASAGSGVGIGKLIEGLLK